MIRSARIVLGLSYLAAAGMAAAQNPDYKALHNMLIQFYGYQRAGDKTIDNKNPFYKTAPFPHSADNIGGKDLSSGWYDAGDFVKFGLPLGFSVYCLLKGYDVFPRAYDDVTSWNYSGTPDQIPDILGEVKIATDYLQRAVVSASQVVVDVGNGPADHGQLNESGYQNSQRIPNREVYSNAGADVAGLYAASLALMSRLYKPHDAAYAAACLAKAKEAYTFGNANKRLSTQQNDPATGKPFYVTTTYLDKLAAGAVELYRATGEATYLEQAKTHLGAVKQHYYVLGFANAGDLAAFELKRIGVAGAEAVWITDVSQTMARVVTAANASALIKGAFINSDWGNAGNAACAGFSAALAFMVTGDEKYLTFARNQAHWVAGLSPFSQSYIVGFGNGTSIQPHHRNDVTKLNGVRLKGGVVSGPSPSGAFDPAKPEASSWSFNGSDPGNYKNTEVALNYNAGMVGLVAFLSDYDNPAPGQMRIKTALSSTPAAVDLNTGRVTISGAVEPAGNWKVTLTGRTSQAKRTVTGTGTAVSVTWAGESDAGSFLAGEVVEAMLDTTNVPLYHHSRAKTSFSISAVKKEAFKATDIKVDDFEDGDASTAQGGVWTVFGDGKSATSPAAPAAAVTPEGEAGSKALAIRLTTDATVTPRPFVGVKAAFNAAGTAVGLGQALSIVFDVKATPGTSIWVELEQSDITDGAYFGRKIDFATDMWNRIRIPISTLEQPAWKTAAKGLNIGSVKSLRITNYGPNSVRFIMDNLHIEGLSIQTAPVRFQGSGPGSALAAVRAGRDGLRYFFQPPEAVAGEWQAEVLDAFGRTLEARNLGRVTAGMSVEFPGLRLNPGWYFLRHTAEGTTRELIQRIHVRPESH